MEHANAAERHGSSSVMVNHYLVATLQGGAASTLAASQMVSLSNSIGYQGTFGLGYELRAGSFIMHLGAEAEWMQHGQKVEQWEEHYSRLDREQMPVTYNYRYFDFQEKQQNLHVAPIIEFGGCVGEYGYIAAGVKVRLSLWNRYASSVTMSTDGSYAHLIQPIRFAESYGFYPLDGYAAKGSDYWKLTMPYITPILEGGARIPIHTRSYRFGMRIGAYVEYGIPFAKDWINPRTTADSFGFPTIADYSRVDLNPMSQTQQNLKSNLYLRSVLTSPWLKSAAQNLSVGIKMTLLLNVTPTKHICVICED